jgi:hypothetical protein
VSGFITKVAAPVFLGLAVFTGPHGTCPAAPPAVVTSQRPERPGDWNFRVEVRHPDFTNGQWVVWKYCRTYLEVTIAKKLAKGRGYEVRVIERI